MRNEIFVDTSGWLCFLDRAQAPHERATRIVAEHVAARGHLVSTSEVFSELLVLLSSRVRISRPQILETIATIRALPFLEIVHITPELHQTAFELLQSRLDKDWSWTDATSFLVMRERGINVALTTDHHFEQAGFTRLLP